MMQSEIAQKIFVEIESEREIEWGKHDPFLQYSVNRRYVLSIGCTIFEHILTIQCSTVSL